MSGEFERKAMVVVTAQDALQDQEGWETIFKKFDLGFPYAFLVVEKHGTLNKKGKEAVEETYAFLRDALEIPEDNYLNYADMLDRWEKN